MALSPNMFGSEKIISEGSGGGLSSWLVFLISQFIFGAALTTLYLGMRGIMRLGGFVASGGPYAITHPAPGWVWVMPVSIILGLTSVFVSFGIGRKIGGLNLMALSWSAVCLSLGWNFMEFGIKPHAAEGPVWGDIISGAVIILIGAIPLILIILVVLSSLRNGKQSPPVPGRAAQNRGWGFSLILQLTAVGLGVFLGSHFFKNLFILNSCFLLTKPFYCCIII
jgi:hypothetical protein